MIIGKMMKEGCGQAQKNATEGDRDQALENIGEGDQVVD